MVQQTFPNRTSRGVVVSVDVKAAPDVALRLVGALLALGVAAAHVADQGGVTAFTSPDWLGWSYRLIEVGGVATAIALMLPRPAWLGWVSGLLLGVGPFVGFIASRTVGAPGDPGDVGNWGDWVGTLALVVEAALVILAVGVLHLLVEAGAGRRATGVTPAPIVK